MTPTLRKEPTKVNAAKKNEGKPGRKPGRPFGSVTYKEEADRKKARKNSQQLAYKKRKPNSVK